MGYFLKRNTIDCAEQMDITEAEFNELKEAKRVLRRALDIEDKYELLISSYIELEQDALCLNVKHMVSNDFDYIEIQKRRTLINKRLVSILTTARLYLEKIAKEASSCTNNPTDKDVVDGFRSEKFDTFREYKFVEKLRNIVQHHSLPVHGMTFGTKLIESECGDSHQYTSSFMANKEELEKSDRFSQELLDELPEKLDLLHEIRVYISAISDIQRQVRGLINEAVTTSRNALENMINRYKDFDESGAKGLVAVHETSDDDYEAVPILLDWDDVRLSLVKKNQPLVNLDKKFVRSNPEG